MTDQIMGISRRNFLVASVGAGVTLAFGLSTVSNSAQAALSAGHYSPNLWLEIDTKGKVLIHITQAEMGQHIGTALAQIVAGELAVDWNDVSIDYTDSEAKWGYLTTGGSWSVTTKYAPMAQAGVAGRLALIEAGATLLGVKPSQCHAKDSVVSGGGKSITYGDIVQRGKLDKTFSAKEMAKLPLTSLKQLAIVGKKHPKLDIPPKIDGSAQYGIDVVIEGMVYAKPVIAPTRFHSKAASIDDTAAKKVKGYLGYKVLSDPSAIVDGMVVVWGDTFWAAAKASKALKVDWQTDADSLITEADIIAKAEQLAADPQAGALFYKQGKIQAPLPDSDLLTAQYTTATAMHFTMEPMNATVEFRDKQWHVHAGSQWQSLILPVLAKSLGVTESDVLIHTYYLGGGFGRRLNGDYMIPAALLSKAIKRPVKLLFDRPDDMQFDNVRSASLTHFKAEINNKAWHSCESAAVAGWPTMAAIPAFLAKDDKGKPIDPFAVNGMDHWYDIPNQRIRAINNPLVQDHLMPGWLRSVGPGWTNWGVESFVDEVAAAMDKDPLQLRQSLLTATGRNAGDDKKAVGGAKRQLAVLNDVAKRGGWGNKLPSGQGMGLACCGGQERDMPTWVAALAHVSVNQQSGAITLDKLTVAIDCGKRVSPDGALAQAQGALLWGASLALHEGGEVVNSRFKDNNLDSYTPMRINQIPEMDIKFLDNDHLPTGMGEPPVLVVAPAIANAVYNATGVRLRHLPMKPKQLLAGLKN